MFDLDASEIEIVEGIYMLFLLLPCCQLLRLRVSQPLAVRSH